MAEIEKNVNEVFDLFEKYGNNMYGDKVTQTSHMIQCAMNAEKDNQPPQVPVPRLYQDYITIN